MPAPKPLLHLIKLSVGTEDAEDLARWQKKRLRETGKLFHRTRMHPKREQELLAGGSIYWVIRGLVRCRQRLTGFDRILDDNGRPLTLLLLHRELVLVQPVPHRAFQGWRYLDVARAPHDLSSGAGELPANLAAELRQLGAW
jgi:hypothetical protein